MEVDIITPIYRKQEELYNSQSDDDNIIFLDIDGVLNYVTCIDRVPHSSAIFGINQYNVALLSQIVKKTNAKIVLTSSWKSGWELDHFKDVDTIYLVISLALQDLYIMDKTVDEVSPSLRGEGIINWLHHHNYKNFVILDDEEFDYSEKHLYNHFVYTDYTTGLIKEDVNKAVKILEGTQLNEEGELV